MSHFFLKLSIYVWFSCTVVKFNHFTTYFYMYTLCELRSEVAYWIKMLLQLYELTINFSLARVSVPSCINQQFKKIRTHCQGLSRRSTKMSVKRIFKLSQSDHLQQPLNFWDGLLDCDKTWCNEYQTWTPLFWLNGNV